nr:hypothetical protein [Tanacetum cinerariifolium]
MENYKNISQDIRNHLDAKAEAVQIILTRIDNYFYSIVDACLNACEMWKDTERDGESLESYYSRFYKKMNELFRNKYDVTNHQVNIQFLLQLQPEWQRLARTANPLALVTQLPVYHPQNHPTHYTQNSSTIPQQDATINKGKAITNSPQPTYDQEPTMIAEDDEITSSNTSRENQDNTPRINRGIGYDNQIAVNVSRARENVEQADWRDDTDDEPEDQELEAHYLYMAQIQEVTPDAADNSGPIFDVEPLQKVQNDNDNYNVFANDSEHPKQPESVNDTYPNKQGDINIPTESLDMSNNRGEAEQDEDLAKEHDLLAFLIKKTKQ